MSHEYLPIKGLSTVESTVAWNIAAKLPPSPKKLAESDPLRIGWEAALAALVLELARYLARYCEAGDGPLTPEDARQRAARLRDLRWYNVFARIARNRLLDAADRKYGSRLAVYGYTAEQGVDACCDAATDRANTDGQIRTVLNLY